MSTASEEAVLFFLQASDTSIPNQNVRRRVAGSEKVHGALARESL